VTTIHSAEEIARLLELSNERGMWHALVLAAWKDGYRAGGVGEYERGYQAAVADVKAAEHALHNHLRGLPTEAERWTVRGEPRARAAYGQPHREDFPGVAT
jgi:hypothetical protein